MKTHQRPVVDAPLAYRVPLEMKERLRVVCSKLEISESDLCRKSLNSTLEAIEAANYRVVLPLKLYLAPVPTYVPAPESEVRKIADELERRNPGSVDIDYRPPKVKSHAK